VIGKFPMFRSWGLRRPTGTARTLRVDRVRETPGERVLTCAGAGRATAYQRGLTTVHQEPSLRDVMTRRAQGIVVALLSLTAFAVGLTSVCLPDDVHQSAYYDGDEDDVGIVPERQTLVSHVGIVESVAHLAPPLLSPLAILRKIDSSDYVVAIRRSESRAPPA
jgi:hypothetical protein